MKRMGLVLLATTPLALILAGCSSGGAGATNAAPTTNHATSAPASAAATRNHATTAPASAAPTSQAPKGSAAGGTGRCHTGDLTVSLAVGEGGGAAGSLEQHLKLTNKSDGTCTVYGYPGVSWVAGNAGDQVNAPFARTGDKPATVKLGSGESADVMLVNVQAANLDAAKCKPVEVRGFRVYPPDEKDSVFVSAPQKACSAQGVGIGQVYAARAA